jgi:MarR family transcriptional regulator, temperature-dependent positive regulator of motility
MRKLRYLFAVLLVSQILFIGTASAEYQPQYDMYIEISTNGNLEYFPLDSSTAQAMFEQQESIHEQVEKITGRDVDHSYIWIVIDGEPILAVDPPVGGF